MQNNFQKIDIIMSFVMPLAQEKAIICPTSNARFGATITGPWF